MKWKEVSHTLNQLAFLARNKKSTWVKSCKESSKGESDITLMAGELVSGEKLDEKTRAVSKG